WQAYEHAEGYLLTIYSDELHTDTLHIFEFNAAGEFVGEISLRDADASHSHTISGLASGTQYYYTLETLGSGVALEKQTGSFTTLGGTTGIDDSLSKPAEAKKAIGYYSITGQQLSKDKEPESGLYIIKYDNGTAEKRMKK
ncbi:MAG: hypothetical protein LBR81_10360, partial [Prevotellaceae bacterium]|nr:hypothetical protein [Prevotellaceae bacterium]